MINKINKFSPIFLALVILLCVNGDLLKTGLFYLNRKDIIEYKCTHLVPHCEGKCFLKKELDVNNSSSAVTETKILIPELLGVLSLTNSWNSTQIKYLSYFEKPSILNGFVSIIIPPPKHNT